LRFVPLPAGSLGYLKYDSPAGNVLPPPHDEYVRPTPAGIGSGLRFATSNTDTWDLGLLMPPLTFDDLTNPVNQIFRISLVPMDLPGGYAANVAACNGQPVSIGDQIPISPTTPAVSDFSGLFDQDPGASWNPVTKTIDDSCAPVCASLSPRLVAIALFDVDIFQYRQATGNWNACPPGSLACAPCPGGIPCVSIANIVGFFISEAANTRGYFTTYPGVVPPPTEAPKLTVGSSYLKAITLVR
jgi:hypothetical protein